MKILLFLTLILFASLSLKADDSNSNQKFMSLEDLAIYGAKSYDCNNYAQALIAKEIIRENLLDLTFGDELTDEQLKILETLIKTQWEKGNVEKVTCLEAKDKIKIALKNNQRIKDNDYLFKDLNKFLELKSFKSFFGIKLQDNVNNYKLISKENRPYYTLGLLKEQLEPPLPNPIFTHYFIYRHPNFENLDIVHEVRANNQNISKEACFQNLNYIVNFYMNSLNANFLANEITKEGIHNSLSDAFITYDMFKNKKVPQNSFGYNAIIELNNSNEQIRIQCRKLDGSWHNSMSISLIETDEKVTNISKGL